MSRAVGRADGPPAGLARVLASFAGVRRTASYAFRSRLTPYNSIR